jgi:hypothetical protein
VCRPLIKDYENRGNLGLVCRGWTGILGIDFGKAVQRRGAHVFPPEIGSRDGEICFGGILGNHAELRRKSFWGNFIWSFLRVLLVSPRGACEEGGQ